jgi:glycosyltransferase involved in cell wall biosynthesis
MSTMSPPTLLCSANFPAGAGYAWDFIEALYAGVASRLEEIGVRTYVAYPGLERLPKPLEGSPAVPIDRAFRVGGVRDTRRACSVVREVGATVLYMADRPAWHPGYVALRRAGVHGIVVHDHTSGSRSVPTGLRRAFKRARLGLPGALADQVIAVSDFVAARKLAVDLVPGDRVTRIWNSLDVASAGAATYVSDGQVRAQLDIDPGRPIILAACRAARHKGVHHLLRAFDALEGDATRRPVLIYAGDGPALPDLRLLRETLEHAADVHILGYRTDVHALIDVAAFCVVPSVWAEAFGLAALEPMVRRRAVIASNAGGLPEVVSDQVTGLLVPPADEQALTRAMQTLLRDPDRRQRMGEAGNRRANELFDRRQQLDQLTEVLARYFPHSDAAAIARTRS